MPRNKAHAPLLVEGFPTVPSTQPGNAQFVRSQHDKHNKQPVLMDGCRAWVICGGNF